MKLDLGLDGRDAGRALRDALELVWRTRDSVAVTVGSADVARIVALPARRLGFRASRDCIRSLSTLRRLLRDGDVVVTAFDNPVAVIVSLDEYERLTGRACTNQGEDLESHSQK